MIKYFTKNLDVLKIPFLVFSFFTLFFGSIATVSADDTIVVRAQVGSVIAGPTADDEEDDSDDDDDKKDSVAPVSQASVFIEPDNTNASFSFVNGSNQFSTARPAFKGTTTIQNARISLIFTYEQFTLRASFSARADGTWNWVSSEDFPNGSYSVRVIATHPTESALTAEMSQKFSILASGAPNPWDGQIPAKAGKNLFDLFLTIDEQYTSVVPGANVIAGIRLVNFSQSPEPVEVTLEYRILDEQGREVLNQQETVIVDGKRSFKKAFYTQPDMLPGVYKLIVKTLSENTVTLASAEFSIEGKKELQLSSLIRIDYTAILLIIAAIFFLFIILSYFEFIRFLSVKKRIKMVRAKFLKKFL